MMHSNKLIAAIKVNGKVLREQGDIVYLPFGSEYEIYLKNLETKRVLINIKIDGTDATQGGLVLGPNQEIHLERFIGSNLNQGNRFKFIERTSSIENHRGIKAEDGLIQIIHEFEYVRPVSNYPDWAHNATFLSTDAYARGAAFHEKFNSTRNFPQSVNSIVQSAVMASYNNDVGITVPGSISNQSFDTTSFTSDGNKTTSVLRLFGEFGQNLVVEPVTVKSKPKCTSCGKINKATSKFCNECGTSLILFV